jgi:hypothetical protein
MKKYILILGILIGLCAVYSPVSVTAQTQPSSAEERINETQSWTMTVQSMNTLRIVSRIDYAKPAGANYPLEIYVNDKPLTTPLLNKGTNFTYKDGRNFPYQSGNGWMLFYSPDFSANNSSAGGGYQVMTDPGQAYLYKWDISSLVGGEKTMKLVIKNNGKSAGAPIVIRILNVYPIAELGNCTDENSCRAYCGKQENYAACTDYGQKNNIISAEDAAKAKEFADVLKGEGPGGCKDEASCRNYCDGVAHLSECVSFGEKHNLIPAAQLEQAKKVAKALQDGAKMPGQCTDNNSCQAYCAASEHADECLAFAEKAGFIPPEELAQAKKVLPLIKAGQSPGQCKTKAECEGYCADNSHITECINFAEKAGFVSKEEADMVRKIGGKGPGGCSSKAACDDYCNKTENQAACFDFAQKNGLIPEEKLKEMKEGMGRLRAGIAQMPEEMVSCLKDRLGNDIVGKIESGQFTPGPQTGDTINGCVQAGMPKLKEKMSAGLKMATPVVIQCLKTGLGEDGYQKIQNGEMPTPEAGDVTKKCFESMKTEGLSKLRTGLAQMPLEMKQCISDKLGADKISKIESGDTSVEIGPEVQDVIQGCVGSLKASMEQKLNQAPPEIQSCIRSKMGDIEAKAQNGGTGIQEDVQKYVQECMQNFKPQGIPQGMTPPAGVPSADDIKNFKPGNVPDMKNYVPEGIPEGGGPPAGIMPPSGTGGPPTGDMCANFTMVPSCSYVPEGVARDACKKCKGQ